jgi:hypothetical protein
MVARYMLQYMHACALTWGEALSRRQGICATPRTDVQGGGRAWLVNAMHPFAMQHVGLVHSPRAHAT